MGRPKALRSLLRELLRGPNGSLICFEVKQEFTNRFCISSCFIFVLCVASGSNTFFQIFSELRSLVAKKVSAGHAVIEAMLGYMDMLLAALDL